MLVFAIAGAIVALFLLSALTGAPYVPTHKLQAKKAFTELRPLHKTDVVLDIGSGDGVVLQEAMQAGAGRVIGYEINPILVAIAWLRLMRYGSSARVLLRNFWRTSVPEAVTIVYVFGETRDIARMYRYVEKSATQQGRTIELISYGFAVPGIEPVKTYNAHFLYRISPLHTSKT